MKIGCRGLCKKGRHLSLRLQIRVFFLHFYLLENWRVFSITTILLKGPSTKLQIVTLGEDRPPAM